MRELKGLNLLKVSEINGFSSETLTRSHPSTPISYLTLLCYSSKAWDKLMALGSYQERQVNPLWISWALNYNRNNVYFVSDVSWD